MVFRVEAVEMDGGWEVVVDHGDVPKTVIFCPEGRMAFMLAGAAMFSVCDPLERMLRSPSAPDGPPEARDG
jgi:hypothetical protein